MKLVRQEAGGAVWFSSKPFSLNFAACGRVRGPITQEQLEHALAGLGKRHPLLAVKAVPGPAEGQDFLTDEDVPPIPLQIVDRVSDDDWVREAQRDIQIPSKYLTEPMIRCIWVRGGDVSDLILICDHMMADGRSAIFALRDLVALLADPSLEMEPLLVGPLNEFIPQDVADRLVAMGSEPEPENQPAAEAQTGEEDDGEGYTQDHARPVHIETFDLDAAETSALIARCKAERVTVQSALCAAFLTPYAEREPDKPMRHAEIPVDLRPRLARPVGDSYGNMIALAIIEVDCTSGRNLWDVARDASVALASMNWDELFATPLVMLALIGHIPNRPWIIDYDVSISNLGRIDIPERYGELRLTSIYAPIFPATGPKHRILGVSTFAGQIRFTFSSRSVESGDLTRRGLELLRSMLS
jgi:NRPS condensation-like uncharacterized protein